VSNITKKFCKGCKTTEVGSNGFCSICMTSIYGYYCADYPEGAVSEGYNILTIEKSADIVYGEIKPPIQHGTRKHNFYNARELSKGKKKGRNKSKFSKR
jgi:hypothetical protein